SVQARRDSPQNVSTQNMYDDLTLCEQAWQTCRGRQKLEASLSPACRGRLRRVDTVSLFTYDRMTQNVVCMVIIQIVTRIRDQENRRSARVNTDRDSGH